ncbi:MAG: hypothetical protein HY534_05325 [Chloroflexi bacterium]|nr:hypothetical protein [Chloroflexota bacterium]
MRHPKSYRGWMAIAAVLVLFSATPLAAFAHERRTVGKYTFVVGFSVEPAIQGEMNGAQVTVTVPSEDDRAVTGLADTLKVTVSFGGGQPTEFPLRSVFGTPGRYVAHFMPTRSGTYLFNFTGTIEGQQISERFESGPGRFNDVEAVDALQFPDRVPPANEAARAAQRAENQAAEAQAAAESARTTGLVGIVVGALGLIGAIAAIFSASQRRSQSGLGSR